MSNKVNKIQKEVAKERNIDKIKLKGGKVKGKYPNNMKRIPADSVTIIVNFRDVDQRDAFINSQDFKKIYGDLVVLAQRFENKNVETIFNP